MNPYSYDAVIFDLDGVVTRTAVVHAWAWKVIFDEYLMYRAKRFKDTPRKFTQEDYIRYVDGKPRYQGVKSFFGSIDLTLPFGAPTDPPDSETICGIGNRKNSVFREVLRKKGVEVFPSTVKLIKDLQAAQIRVGVASSSKNCQLILKTANIEDLFETRVDGEVSAQLGLVGKPEGDIFVRAAENIGAQPGRSIVVEDATSGVQAGRNGGFGLVLGVARKSNEKDLLKNGADVVVPDLEYVDLDLFEKWFHKKSRPLFDTWNVKEEESDFLKACGKDLTKVFVHPCQLKASKQVFRHKKLVFFLDYDGTLTPIVSRPELAIMSEEMRDVVKKLSQKHMVAIVSGRMREDVQNLVKIDGIFYAGSHGFDIEGPGFSMVQPKAKETLPTVAEIIKLLKKEVGNILGTIVEEKKFSVAVHYRLVKDEKQLPKIKEVVERIVSKYDAVRLMSGKMVYEILPNIDWNKGKAIRWIMKSLDLSWAGASIFYIGDDVTDEFAFRTIRTRGTGILVAEKLKPSSAEFQVETPDEVRKLFLKIIESS